jgi:hypothetical protein
MKSYVVSAENLDVLNALPPDCPRLVSSEWINRGTNRKLNRQTIGMLLRTRYKTSELSPSVARLHHSAGLRIRFESEGDRHTFAALFLRATASGRAIQ